MRATSFKNIQKRSLIIFSLNEMRTSYSLLLNKTLNYPYNESTSYFLKYGTVIDNHFFNRHTLQEILFSFSYAYIPDYSKRQSNLKFKCPSLFI